MPNQFMFYKNFYENVPEELRKEYCYALARFVFDGELPEDPIIKMMVKLVEPSLFNKGGAPVGNKNASKKSDETSETTTETTCQNNFKNNLSKQPQKQPLYKTKTETKTETETESLGARNDAPGQTKRACRFENSGFLSDGLPESFAEEAAKLGFENVAEKEYLNFRDYWIAKSGQDATKTNWLATWRNWLRRSSQYGGSGGAAVRTGPEAAKSDNSEFYDEQGKFDWRAKARSMGAHI